MMFVRPGLLLLLIPWLFWLYWFWRKQGRHGQWSRLFDPELLNQLRWQVGSGQVRLSWLALGLAGVLLVVAAAGPAFNYGNRSSLAQGHLVVVLDNTASMAAEDIAPSRAVRAQRTVIDWARSGLFQSTAVITYAGSAHWLTPFTRDVDTLADQLNQLTPWLMPAFGNRPDLAFAEVERRLTELDLGRVHLLWITDDASPDRLEAINRTLTHNGRTWIVPIGSDAGGPIPLPDGRGFLNDGTRMVVTRLERRDFDRASNLLNAPLLSLGAQPSLEWLADTRRLQVDEPLIQEVGYWLLLPALLLLLPWYRRGLVYALPLVLLMQPPQAEAQSWLDNLTRNKEQRAMEALRAERPDQAAVLSERPEVRAQAAFDQGNYGVAAELWAEQGGLEGLYNMGNALVHQGDLEGALEAYEAALAIAEHDWPRQNLERVREFLEQQPPPPPEDSDAPDDSDPGDPDADQQGSRANPDEGQEDEDQSQTPGSESPSTPQDMSEGDTDQQQAQEDSDASAEARPEDRQRLQEQEVERILNRIPQTPSSLLQRKFRYQYEQNPTGEDGEQLW